MDWASQSKPQRVIWASIDETYRKPPRITEVRANKQINTGFFIYKPADGGRGGTERGGDPPVDGGGEKLSSFLFFHHLHPNQAPTATASPPTAYKTIVRISGPSSKVWVGPTVGRGVLPGPQSEGQVVSFSPPAELQELLSLQRAVSFIKIVTNCRFWLS